MEPNPRVFVDIESRASSGRVYIELYPDKAPKSVENFIGLCSGTHQHSYLGSVFHRIVAPEFIVQGGEVINKDGTGGTSIFGKPFEDENLGWNPMTQQGLIGMANDGANTNTNYSQFFITLVPTPWLADATTVFGKVIRGFDVLQNLDQVVVDNDDRPVQGEEVVITRCGTLELKRSKEKEHAARLKPGSDRSMDDPGAVVAAPVVKGQALIESSSSDHGRDQPGSLGGPEEEEDPEARRKARKKAEAAALEAGAGASTTIFKGRGRMKFRGH